MKLTLSAGDQTRTVDVARRGNRLWVTFENGRRVELRLLSAGGGRFELEWDHRRIHGAGVVQGLDRQLWVNGRTVEYSCQARRVGTQDSPETDMASPLPAVVLEVLVRPGQAVKAGQKLILLESMKTVLPVQAPRDGIVAAVMCTAGEAVTAGVPLVTMEPAEKKKGK